MRRHVKPLLRPGHPHGHAQGWLVPKQPVFILKPVTIRVAEDVDTTVIPKCSQPAVWAESKVVDVGKLDRQLTNSETGSQHPNIRLGQTGHRRNYSAADNQSLEPSHRSYFDLTSVNNQFRNARIWPQ